MKKSQRNLIPAIAIVALTTACLTFFSAFRAAAQSSDKPAAQKQQSNAAGKPAPKHSRVKMGDIDQQDIEKAMKEVEKSMQDFKEKDWPKVQAEIDKAMKEVDAQKIQAEIAAAMKDVDMEAMKADLQKAKLEVEKAMKEVDLEKMKKEIAEELDKVDMKKIEKEVAEAKKISSEQVAKQMAEVKTQMAKMKIDMKDQLSNVGVQLKAAQKQLQLVKEGLDELERDGLKKKGDKINIEYKEGILYLDGKAQSKEVSDKYRKYFGDNDVNWNFKQGDNDSSSVK